MRHESAKNTKNDKYYRTRLAVYARYATFDAIKDDNDGERISARANVIPISVLEKPFSSRKTDA